MGVFANVFKHMFKCPWEQTQTWDTIRTFDARLTHKGFIPVLENNCFLPVLAFFVSKLMCQACKWQRILHWFQSPRRQIVKQKMIRTICFNPAWIRDSGLRHWAQGSNMGPMPNYSTKHDMMNRPSIER